MELHNGSTCGIVLEAVDLSAGDPADNVTKNKNVRACTPHAVDLNAI